MVDCDVDIEWTELMANGLKSLRGIVGMLWAGHRTYSQYAEDIFITNFFRNEKRGRWLDIGAFHPRVSSNTHLLRKHGWSGINVDVDPTKTALFERFCKNDINVTAAVAGP